MSQATPCDGNSYQITPDDSALLSGVLPIYGPTDSASERLQQK